MKRFSPLLLISTFTIYAYPWKLLAITSFSLSSVVNCCVGDTGAPDLTSITFTSMASAILLMYRPLGVRSVCAVPQPEPRLAAIPRCGAELYPNNNTPAKEATVRLIISFIVNPPQRTFPAVSSSQLPFVERKIEEHFGLASALRADSRILIDRFARFRTERIASY